ncbi:MAG: bifunctional riboflavin kinase/FAD synthetase [Bacteroidetes bacterium]|nr:bifunctional riboflavin kinase/FAD synthetase [Bacteroidota bacterium]
MHEIPPIKLPIVTIGSFDGVHLGHKQIIERLQKVQQQSGGETFVFTFHPHPRQVLFPKETDLKLLTLTEEKLGLLERLGVNHVLVFPFTQAFAQQSAHSYVHDILVQAIGVKKMVIGYDHRFGNNREGNMDTLKKYAAQYHFEVEEIPAHEIDHVNISSSKIRKALDAGDIKTANTYLGYPYSISGKVIDGKKLGRTLGYPTANILIENHNKLIPKTGVYAAKTTINGITYKGMMSIGYNPTTDKDQKIKIELHIFNFDANIYNTTLTLQIQARLRDEEKFASLNDLKNQLHEDKAQALAIL